MGWKRNMGEKMDRDEGTKWIKNGNMEVRELT
jgi:hypothetical protein